MGEELRTYALEEIPYLKVNGRTTNCLEPLTLFWTGSGIEVEAKSSQLWLEVTVDFECFEPWMSVLIDGELVSRQMLMKGTYWLCLFRGLDQKVVKHVQVVKETQPMPADEKCLLQINRIKCDGEFMPVADRKLTIEFVGDSITSGEGSIGAKKEQDWVPMWFSGLRTYAHQTAKRLDADYFVVSQSGWGVGCGWDNNPYHNLPDYYETVCGVIGGMRNEALGCKSPYDFKKHRVDVVVINLGTNDEGAFHSEGWQDPETGKVYKQCLKEDGTFNEDDLVAFEERVAYFIGRVRANNPDAFIIWTYGMWGYSMLPAIYKGVALYQNEARDPKVSVLQLPNVTDEMVGARCHPGVKAHERAAKVLAEYIRSIL